MNRAAESLNVEFSREALKQVLINRLGITEGSRLVLAYSGGSDSQVLLHSLVYISRECDFSLTAAHFDHGLHPDSGIWRERCEAWSNEHGIAFLSARWQSRGEAGRSLEAEAREARYQWLEEITDPDDVVITAHHADDQAETFLLHLFQGKSLAQLAGIAESRALTWGSRKRLVRPLLPFTKAQLLEYAADHGLRWIEDASNYNLSHYRNYIRHQLAPILYARNPSLKAKLVAAAKHCAESSMFWHERIQTELDENLVPDRQGVFCLCAPLDVGGIRKKAPDELADIIRSWLHAAGCPSLSGTQSRILTGQIQDGHVSSCEIRVQGGVIRFYDNTLFLTPPLSMENPENLCWDLRTPLYCGNNLRITADAAMQSMLEKAGILDAVYLQWRKGGEKFTLPGRKHRSSLKKLLQAHRVLPWERNKLPFVVLNNRIIWVHGIGPSEEYRQWFGRAGESSANFIQYSLKPD